MGIVPSIEMVLWVAIGGRATIFGAIIGTVLTNSAKTTFSEAYPEWWPIILGAMFIIAILFFPKGIVGTVKDYSEKWGWYPLKRSVLLKPPSSATAAYTELNNDGNPAHTK
jgi:urea transport system permease protein